MNGSVSRTSIFNFSQGNNHRNASDPYVRWKELDWIIPEIVSGVLILLVVWITFSLVHFGVKSRKWRKAYEHNHDKLSGGIVYTSLIVCALMTLLMLITSQIAINVGYQGSSDKVCEMASDTTFVMYVLLLFSIYIFLWLRQRIFYANSMLKVQFSTTIRVFSGASIVIIFTASCGVIFFNALPDTFNSSRTGCRYYPPNASFDAILQAVCSALLLVDQLTLVGLFVYPLLKNKNWKNLLCWKKQPVLISATKVKPVLMLQDTHNLENKSQSIQKGENTFNTNNNNSKFVKRKIQNETLTKIVFRTIMFSMLSISTDIFILVFSKNMFANAKHRRWPLLVYDVNAFFNLLFVIGSFLSYKEMLISPFVNHASRRKSHSSSSIRVQV